MNKAKKDIVMGRSSHPLPGNNISILLEQGRKLDYAKTSLIDRKNIIIDTDNAQKYPQTDISELKEWILYSKRLYFNLLVKYTDTPNIYQLVDGERRFRAIQMMTDEEYSRIFPYGINAYIYPKDTDPLLMQLDQELANHLQRDKNVFLKRREIIDLYSHLQKLKQAGLMDDDVVSKMTHILNIRERQIKEYIASASLIPELEALLENGQLTMKQAVSISSLDDAAQKYLNTCHKNNGSIRKSDITAAKSESNIRDTEQKLIAASADMEQKKIIAQAEQKIADTMERNNSKHVLRQSAKAAKARKNYEKAKELNDALLMKLDNQKACLQKRNSDATSDYERAMLLIGLLEQSLCELKNIIHGITLSENVKSRISALRDEIESINI